MVHGQASLDGTEVTWFHVDRTVCDDEGCACSLPTTAQVSARKRAARRGEWFAQVPDGDLGGVKVLGPMGEAEARELVSDSRRAKLLRVVEDYS